jgi:maltose-binding protein MalE
MIPILPIPGCKLAMEEISRAWSLRATAQKETNASLNVPIEHNPTIRYMVYNSGYYKVMSNIPKMGQLPTPAKGCTSTS